MARLWHRSGAWSGGRPPLRRRRLVGHAALREPAMEAIELLLEFRQLLVRRILERHHSRASALHATNELVELQMDGARVAVLRGLDQEHHQERDDRGGR